MDADGRVPWRGVAVRDAGVEDEAVRHIGTTHMDGPVAAVRSMGTAEHAPATSTRIHATDGYPAPCVLPSGGTVGRAV